MFKQSFPRNWRVPVLAAVGAALIIPAAVSSHSVLAAESAPKCAGKNKSGFWLNIVAENVKSDDGLIAITVYPDKRSSFLAKGGDVNVGRLPAKRGTTRGCIFLPGEGVYAIAIYHDEDADYQFDRNLLPEEGYGFSNDASTLAGLPAFRSVRLAVPKNGLTTKVKIRYP